MLVALTDPIDPAGMAILHRAGHEVALPGAEGLEALLTRAEAVVVRRKLPDDLSARAPRLLAAVRQGVGVDMIPVENCTAHGVLVANVPGANADSVAEFAIGQMLAIARRVDTMHAELLAKGWATARARSDQAFELRGRTLGIVGMGAIGTRLAEITRDGFRMRVLGHRRGMNAMPAGVERADLDALFAESDFIALACPLTPETRGLASAARIGRMKPTAWLLNVARGPVVDGPALVESLRAGRIGGAALDVYDEQPLAADHPLRDLPNVILTPHAAGLSSEAVERMSTGAAEEVVRILAGGRPRSFINPKAWEASRARRAALGHPRMEATA
ncbi:hydroxyacid dehydrogenase [Pseudoroseomonas wenyumeiae]|uniref:Hydroxyacid dehydrogenase n=1 Tax=Teichococcus wenyumeiae TaxID=2478470 RepID=A0A3A9JFF2_9PROT|nr:hydroxyacid dehydrogenase [Pseudoroseomonas wenyumeiae]RKK03265.1 hydroxyacid dehydrogenase [Pseudoroseomonas wenyumeiae]RMI16954.1 hydroxyacid dehydrogenase [Pseudoroseomonas wenyumeiae]